MEPRIFYQEDCNLSALEGQTRLQLLVTAARDMHMH